MKPYEKLTTLLQIYAKYHGKAMIYRNDKKESDFYSNLAKRYEQQIIRLFLEEK